MYLSTKHAIKPCYYRIQANFCSVDTNQLLIRVFLKVFRIFARTFYINRILLTYKTDKVMNSYYKKKHFIHLNKRLLWMSYLILN